jgi:hypothetical protein
MQKILLSFSIVAALIVGCSPVAPGSLPKPSQIAAASPAAQSASPSATSRCHVVDGLPDHACTPGAIDPSVTQDNIDSTICVAGYTAKVRPSTSVTNRLKLASMQEYGQSGSPRDYEYDHLISLELGGAPSDTRNLFPESYEPRPGAHEKDLVENYLHRQVCQHKILLKDAQLGIATDWRVYLNDAKN